MYNVNAVIWKGRVVMHPGLDSRLSSSRWRPWQARPRPRIRCSRPRPWQAEQRFRCSQPGPRPKQNSRRVSCFITNWAQNARLFAQFVGSSGGGAKWQWGCGDRPMICLIFLLTFKMMPQTNLETKTETLGIKTKTLGLKTKTLKIVSHGGENKE